MHYQIAMITHGWPLVNQSSALLGRVDNILVELHLSETNGSCRARTLRARLIGRDANHYAISPARDCKRAKIIDNRYVKKFLLFALQCMFLSSTILFVLLFQSKQKIEMKPTEAFLTERERVTNAKNFNGYFNGLKKVKYKKSYC